MSRYASRNKTSSAALTLALTLGSLALPSAEAAQTRKASHRERASIQEDLSARISFQGILDFLQAVAFKDGHTPWSPRPHPESDEGSGLCPNGRPPGHNHGGN
jgi:hypothetical protein